MDKVDTIIANLKVDSEVSGIVGDRIYWVKPPGESYTFPFLTVIEGSNTESDFADDEEYEELVSPIVEIFSKTPFRTLQYAVQHSMSEQGFTREAGPDEWIPELKCYHKSINFR